MIEWLNDLLQDLLIGPLLRVGHFLWDKLGGSFIASMQFIFLSICLLIHVIISGAAYIFYTWALFTLLNAVLAELTPYRYEKLTLYTAGILALPAMNHAFKALQKRKDPEKLFWYIVEGASQLREKALSPGRRRIHKQAEQKKRSVS